MARYIDADRFKSKLETSMEKMHIIGGVRAVGMEAVIASLDRQPTADVAPKSEVAREIFEEIEKKVKSSLTIHLEEINKEHIKDTPLYDRHSGIIFAMKGMDDFIAELKKKYTEEG